MYVINNFVKFYFNFLSFGKNNYNWFLLNFFNVYVKYIFYICRIEIIVKERYL